MGYIHTITFIEIHEMQFFLYNLDFSYLWLLGSESCRICNFCNKIGFCWEFATLLLADRITREALICFDISFLDQQKSILWNILNFVAQLFPYIRLTFNFNLLKPFINHIWFYRLYGCCTIRYSIWNL